MTEYAASLADILEARARIAPHAHVTPVMTCSTIDRMAGRRLFFKCENLQKVGAFKFRGACNAVFSLSPEAAAQGVVTHSSGNHAQALALAASLRGIEAHIVMPRGAPAVKRRAVEGYGGRVYECEPNLAARESLAAEVMARTGATLVPPYDYPPVIAGQGTIALEAWEQAPEATAIIAPIGGGGMVSGIAIGTRGVRPDARVFAAEPRGADDAARSKAAGMLVPQTSPNTVADGLLTSLGVHTWPVVRDFVQEVLVVSDDEILAAMRLVWERMKLVVEPSAAVGLAAVLGESFKKLDDVPESVIIVLSGGNVDLDRLPWRG